MFLYHGHCTLQAKPCLNSAPHSTCPVGILKDFSHTHKNPNNGVLTKEYGYHKCGVLKNEQQINTGDMRLSQPLHVKASRVTHKATAIQHEWKLETSKNANRMDTQKTWQLAFLSITHDQEVQIEFYIAIEHNIIYNIYIFLWNFCNLNQNMKFKKIMGWMRADESHRHCLRKPEQMAESFQTNPCW